MQEMNWEPLPKRRRKHEIKGPSVVPPVAATTGRAAPSMQQEIENAVQQRMDSHRAKGSLTSKDGCPGENYEYLDHTADVQCHTWGKDLKEAFEAMAPCMFNYMTDLSTVDVNLEETISFTKSGHDMQSLLFGYMDELLYRFCTDSFCIKRVEISEFDGESFTLTAKCYGDIYDPTKNPQGTEIKAVTYSNMQIHVEPTRCDLFVIVDI